MKSYSTDNDIEPFGSPQRVPRRVSQEKYGKEFDKTKKTLVFDLDQTLIYLTTEVPSKAVDSVLISNEGSKSYAIKRPGLESFLKEMSVFYNICIYVGKKRKHAVDIVEAVGLAPYIFEVYSREHCVKVSENTYMKSLMQLGFSLSNTVFVDDSASQMRSQPLNGILIQAFKGDPFDGALDYLSMFLQKLAMEVDVRPVTDKLFAFYESQKEPTERKLKTKKKKSNPKDSNEALPLIVEAKEEDEAQISPALELRKINSDEVSIEGSRIMYSQMSKSTSGSDSPTTSFYSSLSDNEMDVINTKCELGKIALARRNMRTFL
eukprot:CAMPEP_0176439356 /NCGR_PEP_ID=MMETSP0127-20121128/19892_1 /TAXON_ID=938130 /ORGANISM="Platyophrya macrostoma, Strain WH" /LENGTH=319 /DNA_ID=CAMNT_0017823605 /DNA_START=54 /DNA_END=1013 /DNA_ORIENTATION=-